MRFAVSEDQADHQVENSFIQTAFLHYRILSI